MSETSTGPEVPVTAAQADEALRLVLGSQTFARAEKLQRFLKYVSELTFRGDAGLVHEHLIAVEVFGRGEAYSPGEDSVVRRQAHALRRKLKDYYASEGHDDRIQIELPLGSYVPVFRERHEVAAGPMVVSTPLPVAPATIVPTRKPAWRTVVLSSAGLIAVLAIFGIGWFAGSSRTRVATNPAALPPAIREIWGPWLAEATGAVVCFSNPATASVRQFTEPLQPNPEHQGIAVTPGQDTAFRRFFRFPEGGNIYLYPLQAQAKMGEALAAVSLTSFFTNAALPVQAMQSKFMTWETLRRHNVILLGHADSNQWIEPVLRAAPFTVAPTDARRRARILNSAPREGEHSDYFPTIPDANKSFALVSMLPGVDGSHEILVIAGLDTSSTTAAADYLMSKDSAEELLRRLKSLAPQHRGAWHFQAVLETDVRDTVPLKAFPVALRVL